MGADTPTEASATAAEAARARLLGAVLAAGLAALLFAAKGVVVKLAYGGGVDPTRLLGLRMVVALPFLLGLAWWLDRRAQPQAAPARRRDTLAALALGILGYHVASWLDFYGLQFVEAATERVVLFLYPTVVALGAWWLGRQALDRRGVLGLALTYAGLLLTWGNGLSAPVSWHGGVLVIAVSAVIYAAFLLLSPGPTRRLGGPRFMVLAMLGGAVGAVIHLAVRGGLAVLWPDTPLLWGCALFLGLGATVLPALLTGHALGVLGPARFAVVSCLGPVGTAVLGWWLLGEVLGVVAVVGLLITSLGALLPGLRKR